MALDLAKQSGERFQHGAVVVKSGKPISMGVNKRRTDPLAFGEDTEAIKCHSGYHAEVSALKRIKAPNNVVLYVARVNAAGMPAMSKPCSRCQEYIDALGIKKIIFTTDGMQL